MPLTGLGRVGCGRGLSLTSTGLRVEFLTLYLIFFICQMETITIYFIRPMGDIKGHQGFTHAQTSFFCKGLLLLLLSRFSHVRLCATP